MEYSGNPQWGISKGRYTSMFIIFLPIALGIILIGIGIVLLAQMYGPWSTKVDAECIDVSGKSVSLGVFPRTHYRNTKAPMYRYWYGGKEYLGQPLLRSNRPGYHPKLGPCEIRINSKHPEKVYSSERKSVAGMMIGIGALYLVMEFIALKFLPF